MMWSRLCDHAAASSSSSSTAWWTLQLHADLGAAQCNTVLAVEISQVQFGEVLDAPVVVQQQVLCVGVAQCLVR